MATSFFMDLFASNGVSDASHILNGINPCISADMNQQLTAQFTRDEVLMALKLIRPSKAPGFNGFPQLFFNDIRALSRKMWSDLL